jgi:hypothetical protein
MRARVVTGVRGPFVELCRLWASDSPDGDGSLGSTWVRDEE